MTWAIRQEMVGRVLFAVIGWSDYLDGIAARVTGQYSRMGALLDYDQKKNSTLVLTLSHYLECGGSYEESAAALHIHRSTLRYRLGRIREITQLDLNDVDSRLNLHVATRAWQVLQGRS